MSSVPRFCTLVLFISMFELSVAAPINCRSCAVMSKLQDSLAKKEAVAIVSTAKSRHRTHKYAHLLVRHENYFIDAVSAQSYIR